MKKIVAGTVFALATFGCTMTTRDTPRAKVSPQERGRYLVQIAGCNDCHTPGYLPSAGKVDEKLWLTGDTLGWNGPWGTTYPPNLRLHMQTLTEAQWLEEARTREMRPPMPWYVLRMMPDEDLRALYAYIHSAGPAGGPAPAYLPPGVEPPLPAVKFMLPPPPGQ